MLILENISSNTVQNTLVTHSKSSRVTLSINTITTSLNTDQADRWVLGEWVHHSGSVRSTANTSDDCIWKTASLLQHLLLGLVTNNRLEGTDDSWERMWSDSRTDDVVGGIEVDDPSAESLVNGITESLGSALDGNNLSSKELDTEDIQSLATDVLGSHVDGTWHVELSADGGGSDTVLSGTSLGDDLGLAQTAGEKDLTECIVDLVGSSVVQVLTLEVDVSTTGVLGETLSEVEVAWTTHPLVVSAVLLPELWIILDSVETVVKLLQAVHQRLWNVSTSELSKARWDVLWVRVLSAVKSVDLIRQSNFRRGGDDSIDMHSVWLLLEVLIDRLSEGNLVRSDLWERAAATDLGAVLLDHLGLLTLWCVGDLGDDLGADNDSVSHAGYGQEVLAGGNSKTNGTWLAARELLDLGQKLWDALGKNAGSTSDAHARDNVDERVRKGAQELHTLVAGAWSDQRNVGKSTLGAEVAESNSLFWWEIDDNETVDTGLFAVGEETLLAVLKDWVVVSHEEDWDGKTLLAGIADVLQEVADVDAVLESDGVGLLNGWAVGDWVGEWNTELNDVWYVLELVDEVDCRIGDIPAPPAWRPSMISMHDSPVGKPAVKYATKADWGYLISLNPVYIQYNNTYSSLLLALCKCLLQPLHL